MDHKIVAAILFMCATSACAPSMQDADLLIENVTVYRGDGSIPFLANVAVADGRFLSVDPRRDQQYNAAETVDGTDHFLTPGLWDMHVHVRTSSDGGIDVSDFLRHGVTSVRDLGGLGDEIRQLQASIEAGAPGPTIYASFETLNGESFGEFQRVVATTQDVNEAIDEHASNGADQIKIHRALSPDLVPVAVRAAQTHGLEVTGHIPLGMHPLDACRAGMGGVEHVGSFLEAYASATENGSNDAAVAYLLSDAADALYACLADNDVEVTPTLVVYQAIGRKRAGSDELPEEFIAFIDKMKAIAKRMYDHDVTLMAGTDTSALPLFDLPVGSSLIDELKMLEDAGIPNMDILAMATGVPALAMNLGEITGTVHAGKTADFILLSADPGNTIANLEKISAVYRAGSLAYSPHMDR